MPSEDIGECGGAQYPDKDWITAELELGICYIRHACGEAPAGYELDIIWHEHDVGEYATIGITWDGFGDAPWDYISRAESALQRFHEAVNWSQLVPEPKGDAGDEDDEDDDEPDDEDDQPVGESDVSSRLSLFTTEDEPRRPIELYRPNEMIEADQQDWHMALLIFREMGWLPERPLEAYVHPLTFIKHDEGVAMQRAGRSLYELILREPFVSTSVQMDLGLFYHLAEFVGGGAFIVGRPGSYENAKANDF